MYKKQLTVQKILCFAALAVCALMFLYSLGLMTDLYDSLYYTMMDPSNPQDTWVTGSPIYYDMQPFNRQLLANSIVMVLLACSLFITSTHSRRRYYVGNVISTVAFAGVGAGMSVWSHLHLDAFKAQFLQINFDELAFFSEMMETPYIDSTFWFDAHYAVFSLMLFVCAALVLNMVWKFSLMRAEKRLIEEGRKVSA